MNESKIVHLYKISAIVTLAVGILFTVIPNGDPLTGRLWSAFLLNVAFHGMYFFISLVPLTQLEWLNHSLRLKRLGVILIKFFAGFILLASILATIFIIVKVINHGQHESLISICVFFAMFLGGCSLLISLNKIQ